MLEICVKMNATSVHSFIVGWYISTFATKFMKHEMAREDDYYSQ
jgi:hypothetical protein